MLKDIFKLNRNSYRLIVVMVVVSLLGIGAAMLYYGGLKQAEDPRTLPIKAIYKEYSLAVEKNLFDDAFSALNKMEKEYRKIDHYRESFEIGVILTNRAALYLSLALHHSPEAVKKADHLAQAEKILVDSSALYQKWGKEYRAYTDKSLRERVAEDFRSVTGNPEQVIEKRISDIRLALNELDRRLSVNYTNLGIIKRHRKQYKDAAELYKKAIQLWPDNHTAKNNLRVLLGKDPKKRSFIEKMFPKKRN